MSPAKGQKIKDDPIEKLVHFRADGETMRKLEVVSEKTGKSKSEVIRDGIDMQYHQIKE